MLMNVLFEMVTSFSPPEAAWIIRFYQELLSTGDGFGPFPVPSNFGDELPLGIILLAVSSDWLHHTLHHPLSVTMVLPSPLLASACLPKILFHAVFPSTIWSSSTAIY